MKRNLQFLSMLLLMIVGETSFAWAQTTIVVTDQAKGSGAGSTTANGKTVAYTTANNHIWYLGDYDMTKVSYIEVLGATFVWNSDGTKTAQLKIGWLANGTISEVSTDKIDANSGTIRNGSHVLAQIEAETIPTGKSRGDNVVSYKGADFKITTEGISHIGEYDGEVNITDAQSKGIQKTDNTYQLFLYGTAQSARLAIDEIVIHLKKESGEQQTVKLNPTKDTQIRYNNNDNKATATNVEIRTQYKDGILDSDFIGLLGFDLTGIPNTATIDNANLRLVTERYKGGDRQMNIYDFSPNFAENTTYATESDNVNAAREAGTIATFNIAGQSGKAYWDNNLSTDYQTSSAWTNTINLKTYIQAKAGNAIGLMITSNADNTNQKCIYTKEASGVTNTNYGDAMTIADEDVRPLLTVTYTPSTASMLSYEMTVSEANAATLMLPFATTIPDGVKVYTLNYTAGSDAVTATEITTGTLPANTPVLVNATAGNYIFNGINNTATKKISTVGALTGVCAKTIVPENSFILTNGASGVGFRKVDGSTNTVAANRCYLTADGAPARLSIVYDDEATGIETMNKVQDTMNNEVYDLQGRRVSQPTKGLYIVNGKKVILK